MRRYRAMNLGAKSREGKEACSNWDGGKESPRIITFFIKFSR
jgi:hypothetical protein